MSATNLRRVQFAPETERERAIRRMADIVHQMNQAISKAVDAGVTVELVRCARYHDERGQWGDQMIPLIRMSDNKPEANTDPA